MALKEAPSTLIAASLAVDLVAVLAAITNSQPRVMTIRDGAALPSGPFELDDRSLQSGLREWVEQQTRHPLGYPVGITVRPRGTGVLRAAPFNAGEICPVFVDRQRMACVPYGVIQMLVVELHLRRREMKRLPE